MTAAAPKPLNLTTDQRAAIETRNVSIGLSAGAGCGKTFVLTQRFLSHLRPGTDRLELSEIAAITFTDRAAREMRNRVREACLDELRRCEEDHVEHWLSILRNLETARISTIHSFCTRLIRTAAVELDVDPRFGLLDPAAAQAILKESTRDVLFQRLEAEDEHAMRLVLRYGLDQTRERLATLVNQRFQFDFTQLLEADDAELIDLWTTTWNDKIIPQMLADFAGSEAIRVMRQMLIDFDADFPQMQEKRAAVLDALSDVTDPTRAADTLETLHAHCRMPTQRKGWPNDDIQASFKEVFECVRKEIDKLRKCISPAGDTETSQFAAELTRSAIHCAVRVATDYDQRKRQVALVDFDDLLLLARNLLRDHPQLCQRLASGIKLLMVDEFQDTDPLQADIVRLLCGNELLDGKLFFVGDIKQSIYRFRRADPQVFHQTRNAIPAAGKLSLTKNFRSQPDILNFVNFIFADTMGLEYEPLESPLERQVSPGPAVEFLFAVDPSPDGSKESATVLRQREAAWIAARISELLADATPKVRIKNSLDLRPVTAGDIVILFRALSDVALYEEALRQQGIDYYLVGGKAFYSQQEVYDVINLCSVIQNPNDEVALLGVLRSPFFNLTDDALFAVGTADQSLYAALMDDPPGWLSDEEQAQIRFAASTLATLRDLKDRVSTSEMLESAVARTGYDASLLLEHLGRRKVANLRKLIDLARNLETTGQFTMARFVDQMRDFVQDETAEELATMFPEKSNVVRLMTIHQSKGLEFPIVFIADMNRKRNSQTPSVACDPELGPVLQLPPLRGNSRSHLAREIWNWRQKREEDAESRRILYVAMTRAADYLILSAGLNAERKLGSDWLQLLDKKYDLQTGLAKRDALLGTASGTVLKPDQIVDAFVHHAQPVGKQRTRDKTRQRSLDHLFDDVSASEPEPIPPLAAPLKPRLPETVRWSVSHIEELVAARAALGSIPRDFAPAKAAESNGEPHSPATADQRGTLMHAVLEFAQPHDRDRIEELTANMAAVLELQLPESFLNDLAARVRRYLESPVAARLAAAGTVLREVDFSFPWIVDNELLLHITGQIDALYQMPEGQWGIVDYKTGQHAAHGSPEEIAEHYDVQCLLYALAVERYTGQPVHDIELVVVEDEVRRIPWKRSPAERNRIADAITAAVQEALSTARGNE